MFQFNENRRSIAEYSDNELELQKNYYRKHSMVAIVGIKQYLADLQQEGLFVREIKNYELSPCARSLPLSISLRTGMPISDKNYFSSNESINVSWDFLRNEVIQHVIESEVL